MPVLIKTNIFAIMYNKLWNTSRRFSFKKFNKKLKKNIGNVEYSVYWINFLSHLLNHYKSENKLDIFKITPKTAVEDQYSPLLNILKENNYQMIFLLCQYFSSITEKDAFLEAITTIFQRNGDDALIDLFQKSIQTEVELCTDSGTLFRSNAVSSKLMKFYSQNISQPYIKFVTSEIIQEILQSPEKFQLDDKKIKPDEVNKNIANVTELISKFIKNFRDSIPKVPFVWRKYCKFLFESVGAKFKSTSESDIFEPKHFAIGGFIILRILNPAIVSPYSFGLCDEKPGPDSRKFLIEFSRILQNFSNGMLDTLKDKHLLPFKLHAQDWINQLKDIFIELASDPKEYVGTDYDPNDELDHSYLVIHAIITNNLKGIQKELEIDSENKVHKLSSILSDIKKKKYPPEFTPNFITKSEFTTSKTENLERFVCKCYELLSISYTSLNQQIFEQIKNILEYTLFNFDYDNPAITPFKRVNPFELKAKTDFGLSALDFVKSIFEKSSTHKQIQNHFFESIIIKLDAYITNVFFSIPNHSKRAVEIKVGISYFENWFQNAKIKALDQNGNSVIFKYTREAINVCIVAQQELLTDEQLRQTICPNFTLNQIEILLKNLSVVKKSIKPEELEEARVKKSIHLNQRTAVELGKLIKSSVFNLGE